MMKLAKHNFEFSVILSIYQVKDYLKEALASLERQTIGFERIQLILVDDGSTDGGALFCDEYQRKHPDQVIVIHKENGGLSSARNIGLQHVEGRYVSFFDPDDILDDDTFAKVSVFMHAHEEEIQVCCIPYFMFGAQKGPHPLNYKFSKGSRVIDLLNDEDSDCFLLSAATAFYKAETARQMHFDTEMVTAEDAKENLRIFLRDPHLGVVADTRYHYRRYSGSILNRSKLNPGWYIPYLQSFSNWALDEAQKTYGYIPKFVQHTVMYDLQWKLLQGHISDKALNQEEAKQYQELLMETCDRIDGDVIVAQQQLDIPRKIYLLARQQKEESSRLCDRLLHSLPAEISFLRFEKDLLVIEARQCCFDIADREASYYYRLNEGDLHPVEEEDFLSYHYIADIPIMRHYMCRIRIPVQELANRRRGHIRFCCCYGNEEYFEQPISGGKYSPLTERLQTSYWISHDHLLQLEGNSLSAIALNRHHGWLKLRKESAFLKELLKSRQKEALKAIVCRLAAYLGRWLLPEDIWLITDKANKADDNGEALFRYLVSLGKEAHCHPVFVISAKSSDYQRMKQFGKVIPYMSWRHKIMHLIARHTISAYSFNEISTPFMSRSFYYGDLLQDNKIVFLQHGITKDDVSDALNRFHKNYRLFVTAATREHQSILNGNYGYRNEEVVLTGFPRYDRLIDQKKKYITVMPTWSADLVGGNIAEEGRRELLPGFEKSDYYLFYTNLLNDERLLDIADELGYRLRFLIHPVFQPYVDRFHFDGRIEVLREDVRYSDIFAESAMIVTDYSSVFFDFAYLYKPVLYTQFVSNHYEKGYFDYEKDGFGEVEHTLEASVDRLVEYMQNDCRLKEKYKKRIGSFFAYHDQNNCQRVYEAILSSEKVDVQNS